MIEATLWGLGAVCLWWVGVSLMLRENAGSLLRDPEAIERPPADVLRALAALAPLAYRDNDKTEADWIVTLEARVFDAVRNIGLQPQQDSLRVYASSGIEAFSVVANNSLLVAVRGTQGIVDVVADAAFYPRRVPGGFAHSGFWAYGSLMFQKLGLLDEMSSRNCEVYITGHSLGAGVAQAVIKLAHMASDRGWCPRVSGALLLCSPRTFSWKLAGQLRAIYRDRIVRVSRCRDLVAVIPPRCLGFAHIGRQSAYVDRRGEFHPIATWRFRVIDGIAGAIRDAFRFRLVRNIKTAHSCIETARTVHENISRL